jgi:hypothetical protein
VIFIETSCNWKKVRNGHEVHFHYKTTYINACLVDSTLRLRFENKKRTLYKYYKSNSTCMFQVYFGSVSVKHQI